MQVHAVRIGLLVLAVATTLAAAEPITLVLNNGDTIQATVNRRDGSFLYITLASGGMQAYPIEDVDLEASGLVPPADEQQPATKDKQDKASAFTKATVSEEEGAAVEITDKDVGHVRPPRPGGEESESPKPEPAVAVEGMSTSFNQGSVVITGNVVNHGGVAVKHIVLDGIALGPADENKGQGSVSLDKTLEAGQSVGFSMSIPVEGEVANVRVRASAAVADLGTPPPPSEGKQAPPEANQSQ